MKSPLLANVARRTPGALGLLLRQKTYSKILGSFGHGAAFGIDVWFNHPERISIGAGAILDDGVFLDPGKEGNIEIGEGAYVGRGTIIRCCGGDVILHKKANLSTWNIIEAHHPVTIGAGALLGPHIKIGSEGSSSTNIGDNCWLGAYANIKPGVTIGKDSVIGAASIVESDIPEKVIAVGSPAKVVRARGSGG